MFVSTWKNKRRSVVYAEVRQLWEYLLDGCVTMLKHVLCPPFTGTLRKNLHVTGWMKLRECFQSTRASFLLSLHNHPTCIISVYICTFLHGFSWHYTDALLKRITFDSHSKHLHCILIVYTFFFFWGAREPSLICLKYALFGRPVLTFPVDWRLSGSSCSPLHRSRKY